MNKEKQLKKRKTFTLRLTKFELIHLRDLFSVSLPMDLKKTVSQALAEAEDRVFVETRMWNKVATACKEAELPLDDDAPDFVCAASSAPPVSVFRLAQEPNENVSEDADDNSGKTVFSGVESDEESEE